MEPARILIVEDDETFRFVLAKELKRIGLLASKTGSVRQATAVLDAEEFDVALVDLRLPDGDGLEVLARIREAHPRTEVIIMTGHGTIDNAIEAMRMGAADYIQKPCHLKAVEVSIEKALEKQALVERNAILRDGLAPSDPDREFLGVSRPFRDLSDMISRAAGTDSSVLILGETGVGKDVVAKLVHARSRRARQPLVTVDCTALHEDLSSSELFGHERGAYTGALQSKHGLFEVADQGTIFLDEIGDVSMATQTKLLRVLETGRFRHVGGTRELSVDVRVLAATNRNLEGMMEEGRFRRDLFFRLNSIWIDVPPLRERRDDILVLAEHYLQRMNSRHRYSKQLDPGTKAALERYDWPGNVRELIHVIEHAVVMTDSGFISQGVLPPAIRSAGAPGCGQQDGLPPLHEVERRHILCVLDSVCGNRAKAAKVLEIGERTLYRKLSSYGVE